MKKFIVPVLCFCFLASCSTDDTALNTVATTTTDSASNTKITKKSIINLNNPNNEYDFLGELQAEIMNDCSVNSYTQANIADAIAKVEWVAANTDGFNAISSGYRGLDPVKVQWVLSNADNTETIANNAALSGEGKRLLIDFVNKLESVYDQSDDEVYNEIIAYENMVTTISGLSGSDRQKILTATAVARYSVADGGGRKWVKAKFGINASVNGKSMPEAITMSVTVGLLSDNI